MTPFPIAFQARIWPLQLNIISQYSWIHKKKKKKKRNNYSKPTWGLARFHFTYPWFKTLHFTHLNFNLLPTFGFSVRKQLLQPKHNITRIKNLGFEFFWKSLEGFVSLNKDKDINTCFHSWVQVSLKEFIRFVPTFQIFLSLGQVIKKKKKSYVWLSYDLVL